MMKRSSLQLYGVALSELPPKPSDPDSGEDMSLLKPPPKPDLVVFEVRTLSLFL